MILLILGAVVAVLAVVSLLRGGDALLAVAVLLAGVGLALIGRV